MPFRMNVVFLRLHKLGQRIHTVNTRGRRVIFIGPLFLQKPSLESYLLLECPSKQELEPSLKKYRISLRGKRSHFHPVRCVSQKSLVTSFISYSHHLPHPTPFQVLDLLKNRQRPLLKEWINMVGNESFREHFAQNSLFGAVLPKNEEVLNLLHIPLYNSGG